MVYQGLIHKYHDRLPLSESAKIITLNEGDTPLIESIGLRNAINPGIRIFYKYEGANPTGSFKDRGMTVAITQAVEVGAKAVICASTGNTSASAAAYAARAGVKCFVILPKGKIALGKLSQAIIFGAQVIEIDGNFDDSLDIVRAVGEKYPVTIVNSINPYRIEGQKTAAFEICEQLGAPPTYHVLPVGNAGNITAYWKGYKEWIPDASQRPKMLGFQAAGAAPIVFGHPIEHPETFATAIRIGNPASWKQAETARDESRGLIDMVTDEEIREAYTLMAKLDGVFAEPASAAGVAGIMKYNKKGFFKPDDVLAITLTGSGLKDPDSAKFGFELPQPTPANLEAVVEVMGI
jgi:threonine synthase